MLARSLPESDTYTQLSKGYWLDMMKAMVLRSQAGLPGLAVCADKLINVMLDYSTELMSTPRSEHERAKKELLEAEQVRRLLIWCLLQTAVRVIGSQVTWLGHMLLYAACTSFNCIK